MLGGASAAEAARVQLTVLLALLAVEVVAALTVARLVVAGRDRSRGADYQAWLVPQCGQPTEVETSALKA